LEMDLRAFQQWGEVRDQSTLNVVPFLGTGEDTPNIPAFTGWRWT